VAPEAAGLEPAEAQVAVSGLSVPLAQFIGAAIVAGGPETLEQRLLVLLDAEAFPARGQVSTERFRFCRCQLAVTIRIEPIEHRLVSRAIEKVLRAIEAFYRRALGWLLGHRGILAFTDPFGIRPLIVGRNEAMGGTEYIVASESEAIDPLGFLSAPGG
jgi:hypothetical protein